MKSSQSAELRRTVLDTLRQRDEQSPPPSHADRFKIASQGLQIDAWALDPTELQDIAQDSNPENISTLLELSRAYADGVKTASSRSVSPGAALHFLNRFVDSVDVIYQNPAIKESLKQFSTHEGSDSLRNMPKEMARDMIKGIRSSAAPFFTGEKRKKLHEKASNISNNYIQSAESDNETTSLMLIEDQLGRSLHDSKLLDWGVVNDQLKTLIDSTKESNPERLATVLMWLRARESEMGNIEMRDVSQVLSHEYRELLVNHPDYAHKYSIQGEVGRLRMQRIKLAVFPILSLMSTRTKDELYQRIMKWDESDS